jgi:MFS family permease
VSHAEPYTSSDKRPAYVAYAAHALHDGFTDLMYVLLPLFQAEFGLAYAQTGLLRSIYAGAMALFQVPSGQLAGRFGNRAVLGAGTALAACGYLLAGFGNGFVALIIALGVLGLGLSTQHPIGSELVAETYQGAASRRAIGTYNFAGDIGKMIFPAAIALLLLFLSWRGAALSVGIFGLFAAMAIFVALAPTTHHAAHHSDADAENVERDPVAAIASRANFLTLLSIGVIDSATRMGFLTFLPFLLQQKGASVQSIGFALTLIFAGGALGKFVCGHLGARIGTIATVFVTEGLTALCVLLLIPLSLVPAFLLLPVLGIMLNGTSSVLYGSVPELVGPAERRRAFAIFYTGTIGSGAVSPLLYGLFSDALGIPAMMGIVAGVVLLTLPLAWKLRSAWPRAAGAEAAVP